MTECPPEICLQCGKGELRDGRSYRTKTVHGARIFQGCRLLECAGCGLAQALPLPSPESLEAYYAADYRASCCAGADVADVGGFPRDNLFYYNRGRSIADLVVPYLQRPEPRILDIGAGFGHVLDAFRERCPGASCLAVEFSEICVDFLRALHVEVRSEPVERVLETTSELDVVVLSHVLEHLLDPVGTLKRIRERLRPDGVLYVEVPNVPPQLPGLHPDHVWLPRFDEPHITFFSLASLRSCLEGAGLTVQVCQTAGPRYRTLPSWRYRMPTLRWWLQDRIPQVLFEFLRDRPALQRLRVREREEEFYEYGGDRIWLRSVSSR